MNKKQLIPILFGIIIAACLITAGCVGDDAGEKKWHYSDIAGEITADTNISLVDDYHAAVNKEWLSTAQIPEGETSLSSFSVLEKNIREKFVELIENKSVTGHEAELVRTYYYAYTDLNQRDKDGLKPLEKYTKEIEDIKTLDEFSRFITENKDYLFTFASGIDTLNTSRHTLRISPSYLSLVDSAEYTTLTPSGKLTKDANAVFFKKMLLRLGYTEEQADKMEEDRLQLETELASTLKTKVESSNYGDYMKNSRAYTVDELKALIPNYPAEDVLKGYISSGLKEVVVYEPEGLKKLNELYTEENLDKLKAYIMYMYIDFYADYLDRETTALLDERTSAKYGMNYSSVTETDAYKSVITLLEIPAAKFYIENAMDPKTKDDVISMIHKVIDIYRVRLAGCGWLSEETRNKAIEKLDAMSIHAVCPDDWNEFDYSGLSFRECRTLPEMVETYYTYEQKKDYSVPGTPVDKSRWITWISTLEVNAFYDPSDNSITILAGIAGDPFYNASAPVEYNYAGLGIIIGHEISHGFDSGGSQFDKDGNLVDWWTAEDKEAFDAKTQKVAAYLSTIEAGPGVHVNGDLVVTESIADFGGLAAVLEAASQIDDFDYDAFFRNYASAWKIVMSKDKLAEKLVSDEHPPGSVRVNTNVQQYEEFYTAYDVQQGDGMYLAPEDRVAVW